MSGGVDSSVAAARLVDAGHEVTGVHLALARQRGTLRTGSRGCCTVEDALDARRVADLLGIPFYVWDFSEQFAERVVDDFVAEYAAGRTPNPCLRCNERIKFAALLERALALGFDAVATGHYARVERSVTGSPELHRAEASPKDQSYVLGVLTGAQLERAVFPLGDTVSKDAVRAEAAARGLVTAAKPDSYDICFIPDGDTRGWLDERLPRLPGSIVDESGAVVGQHDGAVGYTVGQRRGLNLGVPSPDGRPRFVLEVRPISNELVVGPRERLEVGELAGGRFGWCGAAPDGIEHGIRVEVQVRAHGESVAATARLNAGELVVRPLAPLEGVAPGQSAVLYAGTRVLGQLTIDRTVSAQDRAVAPASLTARSGSVAVAPA